MNRKLHVLVIPSWYPTKENPINGDFFRVQVKALKELGYKVGVISPEPVSFRNFNLSFFNKLHFYDDGVPVYQNRGWAWFFKFHGLNALIAEIFLLRCYKAYTKKHGTPDLIHVHSSIYATGLRLLNEIPPVLLTEHHSGFGREKLSKFHLSLIRGMFKKVSCFSAVSTSLVNSINKSIPGLDCSWVIIPNMLSDLFENVSIKYRDKGNPFTFFNLGFFSENKGQEFIIKAFAEIVKKGDFRLVLGGDGLIKTKLMELAKRLDVFDRVEFVGSLSRVQAVEYMSACDCFLLGSRYETFGVVVIESLACGKPVVATNCGGPESIINITNGHLVARDDVIGFSNKMLQVVDEYHKYNFNEIRQNCLDLYSKNVVVSQIEQLIKNLISN